MKPPAPVTRTRRPVQKRGLARGPLAAELMEAVRSSGHGWPGAPLGCACDGAPASSPGACVLLPSARRGGRAADTEVRSLPRAAGLGRDGGYEPGLPLPGTRPFAPRGRSGDDAHHSHPCAGLSRAGRGGPASPSAASAPRLGDLADQGKGWAPFAFLAALRAAQRETARRDLLHIGAVTERTWWRCGFRVGQGSRGWRTSATSGRRTRNCLSCRGCSHAHGPFRTRDHVRGSGVVVAADYFELEGLARRRSAPMRDHERRRREPTYRRDRCSRRRTDSCSRTSGRSTTRSTRVQRCESLARLVEQGEIEREAGRGALRRLDLERRL